MKKENQDEKSTKQKLLFAAGEFFATKGFEAATIREIVEKAGANVAAVNYHFGDKEKLYDAVIIDIHERIIEKYPTDAPTGEGVSKRERLYFLVRNMLMRRFDPAWPKWQGVLMAQYMMDPRYTIKPIVTDMVQKFRQQFIDFSQDALEGHATPENVMAHTASIIGQCLFYFHIHSPQSPIPVEQRPEMTIENVKALARHITNFSICGFENVQKIPLDSDNNLNDEV